MAIEKDSKNDLVFKNNQWLGVWQRLIELFGIRLLSGLCAAIVFLIVFSWLANEVLGGETKTFDESVRSTVHQLATSPITHVMRFFTFLGSTLFLTVSGVCFVAAFILANWRRAMFLFLTTMLGAIFLNYSLKISFQRARPEPYFDTPLPSSYSFPSGHALFALCFYGVLAWLISTRIERRRVSIGIWMLTSLFIFLIGFSRIYLSVHYASDVLAGYAAAMFWVLTVITCDFWLKSRENQ